VTWSSYETDGLTVYRGRSDGQHSTIPRLTDGARVLDERHAAADALAVRGMSRSGYAMQGHAGSLTPAGYGNQ